MAISLVISHYINRQLMVAVSAVTSVLLLIIVGGRFIKYLAEAATGKIAVDALFAILLFRLPGFLELLLPLGFFLSVLLVYGRMHLDSEMVVLSGSGISPKRLLAMTLGFSLSIAAIVAMFSLLISPIGMGKAEELIAKQKYLAQFTLLVPGRFQMLQDDRVVYMQSFADDGRTMQHIFIADQQAEKNTTTGKNRERQIAIWADKGYQQTNKSTGHRELILEDGRRYLGTPGDYDYQVVEFEQLVVTLKDKTVIRRNKREALSMIELYKSGELADWVEIQWRFSVIISVFVVACLAVPLSRVNPRQGRFVFIIPAILLYMSYLALLIYVREALEDEEIPLYLGFWWVHLLFLVIAWFAFRLKHR